MITERELSSCILELEESANNYQGCQKLATLYTVYDHLYAKKKEKQDTGYSYAAPNVNRDAESEILPAYFSYVQAKRLYQTGDAPKEKVLKTLDSLAYEISELIRELYRSTDMPEERQKLSDLIERIKI